MADDERQDHLLLMTAGENFVSRAVIEAMEAEAADGVEEVARERLAQLFGADHGDVRPHSGAQACIAARRALAEPGSTVLAVNLSGGEGLTHGPPADVGGSPFNLVTCGVCSHGGFIDYGALRDVAVKVKPSVLAASVGDFPRTVEFDVLAEIARECGATLLVDVGHLAGLIATGHYPSPVPHAHVVAATTHGTLRGPRGGLILCRDEHARSVDELVGTCTLYGPRMHGITAKAVAFGEALHPAFGDYIGRVIANARALAEALMERGVRVVSGGTDTHLVLVDLRDREVPGTVAEKSLHRAGIAVNRSTVPSETGPPLAISGIGISTAALTTRGLGVDEMRAIAGLIERVIAHPHDELVADAVRGEVREICGRFPLQGQWARE